MKSFYEYVKKRFTEADMPSGHGPEKVGSMNDAQRLRYMNALEIGEDGDGIFYTQFDGFFDGKIKDLYSIWEALRMLKSGGFYEDGLISLYKGLEPAFSDSEDPADVREYFDEFWQQLKPLFPEFPEVKGVLTKLRDEGIELT